MMDFGLHLTDYNYKLSHQSRNEYTLIYALLKFARLRKKTCFVELNDNIIVRRMTVTIHIVKYLIFVLRVLKDE
jgi:hypothetical protein